MQIEELKKIIVQNAYSGFPIIFVCPDSTFIAYQYINYIISYYELPIEIIDSLDSILKSQEDFFFGSSTRDTFRLYSCDLLECSDRKLLNQNNIVVICTKVSDDTRDVLKSIIVDVPKLESWQVKDFVYSRADGVPADKLDWLINICGGNIYRLDQEVYKLSIFTPTERKYLFDDFVTDGVFNDLTDKTIFNLTDAIIHKDSSKLAELFHDIDVMDINVMGVVSILYQNIKDIIQIQLNPTATPESLNMTKGKFYAIKYNNVGVFTRDQLVKIFELITSVDRKLKLGELPVESILEYIIVNIFNV